MKKKKKAKKKSSKRATKPRRKAPARRKTAKSAKKTAKRAKAASGHLRKSKTVNFIENIRENNTMIDYMTRLRVLNPPSAALMSPEGPRREGGFVRLAHANEEFTAPVLTKGKSVASVDKTVASVDKIADNKKEDEE